MVGIIAPSRAKSIAELQRFIMDWELRVAEHEARHNECVQDSVKVAALMRMMTAEMAERYIEGPNTYPELRSRVPAFVGEKMIQQSHVPMDIGEVEGEIEGSDDQIDELRGARKPRRDERSTHQRGPGKQPWRASPLRRHEKREADNGHDSVKNQKRKKRALVCYNCGGKGHPARLCPTPSDHASHAVDEEGDTEEESSDEGDVCVDLSGNANSMVQVTKMMTSWEWDVSPQNQVSGSASQLWWTLAQQKTSYLQASAIMSNSVQLAGLMRALDFVEPAERESAITVRGSSRFE